MYASVALVTGRQYTAHRETIGVLLFGADAFAFQDRERSLDSVAAQTALKSSVTFTQVRRMETEELIYHRYHTCGLGSIVIILIFHKK